MPEGVGRGREEEGGGGGVGLVGEGRSGASPPTSIHGFHGWRGPLRSQIGFETITLNGLSGRPWSPTPQQNERRPSLRRAPHRKPSSEHMNDGQNEHEHEHENARGTSDGKGSGGLDISSCRRGHMVVCPSAAAAMCVDDVVPGRALPLPK